MASTQFEIAPTLFEIGPTRLEIAPTQLEKNRVCEKHLAEGSRRVVVAMLFLETDPESYITERNNRVYEKHLAEGSRSVVVAQDRKALLGPTQRRMSPSMH